MEEDTTLIDEFLQGDESSFNRLVLKYQRKVFNIVFGILGNYDDTNEVAQDVFVNVYRKLKKFRKESQFSTWLYRIAVNGAKNRYKKIKRQTLVAYSINNPIETENGPIEKTIPDTHTAREELEKKELSSKIQKFITKLPLKYKEIIVMRDIEGMDYKEIGEITGLNEGTIKSRLHRGRWQLKILLKEKEALR